MRIRKQFATGFFLLVFLMMINICVNAENGSITVKYAVKNHTVPISGATFSILKLIDIRNGTAVLCDVMQKNHVTEEDLYHRSGDAVKKISANMTKKGGKTTGSKGEVCFTDLKEGVYLVSQTGRRGKADYYQMASPSIIQIPVEQQGTLQYDVVIFPKTVEKMNQEESLDAGGTSIKTGDETIIWKWILLMVSAVLMVTAIILGGRRDVHNENNNH